MNKAIYLLSDDGYRDTINLEHYFQQTDGYVNDVKEMKRIIEAEMAEYGMVCRNVSINWEQMEVRCQRKYVDEVNESDWDDHSYYLHYLRPAPPEIENGDTNDPK